MTPTPRLRVMFLIEGFSDVRFILGLSEICDLTLVVPEATYGPSGLRDRVAASGARLTATEVPGGRVGFVWHAFSYCLGNTDRFDVILAQEVARGALAANLAGRIRGVPVLNYTGIATLEYFRCRWVRRQIPFWRYALGATLIWLLLTVNGRLATGWVVMGRYLATIARRYSHRVENGYYYGVDTDYYRPTSGPDEQHELRRRLDLPDDAFLILVSSRVSHEKDPDTVLRAAHLARQQGLNAVVINLGGGYREFIELARRLGLPHADQWVIGRPAAHPMTELADWYRAVDVVAQASLAEGLGLAPLEALACGVPVVATAVGGMATTLPDRARLVPRGDEVGMAREMAWVAAHPREAREQALRARAEFVVPVFDRDRVFADLHAVLSRAAGRAVGQDHATTN